jgi:hypothetical protein
MNPFKQIIIQATQAEHISFTVGVGEEQSIEAETLDKGENSNVKIIDEGSACT